MISFALSLLLSCGGNWNPGEAPHTTVFPLECAHADQTCDGCHPVDEPPGKLDPACIACHLADRPSSHDPETTATCDDCHQGSCDWGTPGNPHPPGFAEADAHGIEASLQGPAEGDCRDCHGVELTGGTTPAGGPAQGCDWCHADNGHPDWRTDCVYCHGGEDSTGAPPRGIDPRIPGDQLSFPDHAVHVQTDGEHRALTCTECHTDRVDALSEGHWFDPTPGVAEVDFSRGLGANTTWDGATCSDDYCHGSGIRPDGVVVAGQGELGCDGCHATTTGLEVLSGLHQAHMVNDPAMTCNDCHAAVIDVEGRIATPSRHVDGLRDVAFFVADIVSPDRGGTCTGSCHDYAHDADTWGHVPDYELPELHGVDSNLRVLDCQACHGEDWRGGDIAQGCDDCHAQEGHPDWRTDCAFCHGGTDGDTTGAPPQDIDDTDTVALISFQAHREHVGTSPIGHATYRCTECHADHSDALSPGHALDGTPGVAEVDLSGGQSAEGGWDHAAGACSNLYCHGDGQRASGTVVDGTDPLDCDACHATESGWEAMSGTHAEHLDNVDITCADCHGQVVNASNDIISRRRHVDRVVDWDAAATGYSAARGSCTITCHGIEHDELGWAGVHPDGFADPLAHGQEALQRTQSCAGSSCHGADLQGPADGAAGPSCDECHVAGWRTDCTYCHGGTGADVLGLPPEDIDNELDETRISFRAHPEHAEGRISAPLSCETCHQGADAYQDAVTDAGHWMSDVTKGTAEVRFDGLAAGASYAVGNCSNLYCHGNGQVSGASQDGDAQLTCNACHKYDQSLEQLSGTHALHLDVGGVTCEDCHGGVVDASGAVTAPALHVDGAIQVDASAGFDAASESCVTSCHDHDHQGQTWTGHHPIGYDDPQQHGQEALFRQQDCATSGCHGTLLEGGASGQGCASCHPANWRSDCTFCHGGDLGDTQGVPPQDIDNQSDPDLITFLGHPAHHMGALHPTYGCRECHGAASATYFDAFTDPGHWWQGDTTAGRAEISFADGLSPDGTYSATTMTCSGLYCHGTGLTDSGPVSDGNQALGCDECHPTAGSPAGMSGSHASHLGIAGVTCADCHSPVVTAGDAIFTPALHADGAVFVDPSTGWSGAAQTCALTCHDVDHNGIGWTGYHPPGYDDPLVHGQEALFRQDACADCHGADLRGGAGDSCDSCHVAGWRSDCTYCHGGVGGDVRGAPPEDLDNVTDEDLIAFKAHPEHTDNDLHPLYSCDTCHRGASSYVDAPTDPDHWLVSDPSPGLAEVKFSGIADGSAYAGGTCSNTYCHGDGQTPGAIPDGTQSLTCNGCHSYDQSLDQLSGTHAVHLAEAGVTCADCHSDVDAAGAITNPNKHVNALTDLDQVATGWAPITESCTISCHSYTHQDRPWIGGHPPGYDDPLVHGQEALFKAQDCATSGCHGTDLQGGASNVACDDCHTAGWRGDCTYCHGGALGDVDGLPPEDLDNVGNEDQITFMAHPEHHDGDDHAALGCEECHGAATLAYVDAFTDPGHWWTDELTPGLAEIDFTASLSPFATFNRVSGTCSGLYCHGDGISDGGIVTDSATGLTCDGCHATSTPSLLSDSHGAHLAVSGVTCADCHDPVIGAGDVITTPSLHVDGQVRIAPSTGWNAGTQSCTGTCHSVAHSGISWSGYHPIGHDDPLQHGQDALFRLDTCTDCHGADLLGGTGDSCDTCHSAGWRSDCTFCHGGSGGDVRGAPPQDLDNTTNDAQISFKAHPEHTDNDIHPQWSCDVCHNGASGYSDAPTDPEHWLVGDGTPGAAEVKFGGIASGSTFSNGTCGNNYCHGDGQTVGSHSDGTTPLTCNGCHSYDQSLSDLSGTHALHLGVQNVSCADCHTDVNATGTITDPTKHVNALIDLDQAGIGWAAGTATCTNSCHNHSHNGIAWTGNHPPGYDAPAVHGQEALNKTQDCASAGCHGTDLGGGASNVSCDSCHTAGWRSDCTYCHGGQLGDTDGLPPEDLDNTTNEDLITFRAHPEHHDGDDHLTMDCDTCHGSASLGYTDAFTDPGHWWAGELTPGVADVDLSASLSPAGTYNAATSTCSNLYCHGNGNGTNGSQADSASGLTCHSCHPDKTVTLTGMSGDHRRHQGDRCSDCHTGVVDTTGLVIVNPSLHVDGVKNSGPAPGVNTVFTYSGSTITCNGDCHGEEHRGDVW